jgi:hypothetical protein
MTFELIEFPADDRRAPAAPDGLAHNAASGVVEG